MQTPSTPLPDGSQTVFDPETDTVYDLERHVSKRLIIKDRMGNTLMSPDGQEARLYHLWNTAAKGIMTTNPIHAQAVTAEAVMGLTREEKSSTRTPLVYGTQLVMNQFCIGLGLFLARNGVSIEVEAEPMSEVEVLSIKKKFSSD